MRTTDTSPALEHLFSEPVDGVTSAKGGFVLNKTDAGLLGSLEKLSAAAASRSANEGATIAAHAQHLGYGLSLMTAWVEKGGNPFANAKWDEAWKITTVDASAWEEIRNGLRHEAQRWLNVLQTPRDVNGIEFTGLVSSIAHLAYHLGAIRQINQDARGPKEGTYH
jgi:hypothetical protein